jgi:hypothetical protein
MSKLLLLGIDLGPINSTYNITEVETEKILRWGFIPVVENNKQTYETICSCFMKSLDNLKLLSKITGYTNHKITVIIELQLKKNPKTIVMSGQALMYFTIQKQKHFDSNYEIEKIKCYHASNKLLYYEPLPGDPVIKTDYADSHYRNKRIAIQQCPIILKRKKETEWLTFFEGCKKKDDLADAYLMILAYIKFEIRKEKRNKTVSSATIPDSNPIPDHIMAAPTESAESASTALTTESAESAESATAPKARSAPPKPLSIQLSTNGQPVVKKRKKQSPTSLENLKNSKSSKRCIKPGDPIPNKPGFIMGNKKIPVKADGKVGLEILQRIKEEKESKEAKKALEAKESKESKTSSKDFKQYPDLKPGDPIPNKAGFIMGNKKVPVKANGKIGLKILEGLKN